MQQHTTRHEPWSRHVALRNAVSMFGLRLLLYALQLRRKALDPRAWSEMLGTSLRWSVFVAGLSLYRSLQALVAKAGLPPPVTSLLSGALAASPCVALHPSTCEELSLYMLARALHGAFTTEYVQRLLAMEFPGANIRVFKSVSQEQIRQNEDAGDFYPNPVHVAHARGDCGGGS